MISILCPTRNRPDNVLRMVKSALDTAAHPENLEFVFYIDNDDETFPHEGLRGINFKKITGNRIVLSEMWNVCYRHASGPHYMHAGDDIIFRSQDWDRAVLSRFDKYEDNIVFTHADDGGPSGKTFGTHGFIHKDWVDTVGYFVPPYFSSDYNDTALNYIARKIGRYDPIEEVLIEHMHPDWGKAELDLTHRERIVRHNQDNVAEIYREKIPEFDQKARALQDRIKNHGN